MADKVEDTPKAENLSEKLNINEYTAETLSFLIAKEGVANLQEKTRAQLMDLKKRQDRVKFLHQLLRVINAETDAKGRFDCSKNEQLQKMLKEAEEMGVEIPNEKKEENKVKFEKDERERLIENVRLGCEDMNFQNDMQIQEITRMTNERYELYQMARLIMKPLHDAKVAQARYAAGRG